MAFQLIVVIASGLVSQTIMGYPCSLFNSTFLLSWERAMISVEEV